jgi:DNA topoisomerase-3
MPSITSELFNSPINMGKLPELVCPKCKNHQLIIRDKIVKCPDEGCSWVQFRSICGVQLSMQDIEQLIRKGKTNLIKGMKSKSGKRFDAYIILNDKAESSFEFENNKIRKK